MVKAVARGKDKNKDAVEKTKKPEKLDVDPSKRLYVRFASKPPETHEIKEMHSLITNVTLPRQKSARFRFLECDSEEDAMQVMNDLKKQVDEKKIKKLFVSLCSKKEASSEEAQPLKFRIQKTGRKNLKRLE